MSETPFALYHDNGCGKPAWLLTEMPKARDIMRRAMFRRLDGTEALESDSPSVCQSCGKLVADFRIERIRPTEAQSEDRQ